MGRKKKNTVDKKIKLNNKQDINIGYSGIVNITVTDEKNKPVAQSKHKNNGSKNLFKFLADCLCGNAVSAINQKPSKIVLLTTTEAITDANVLEEELNRGKTTDTKLIAATRLIAAYGRNIPDEVVETDETKKMLTAYTATLHFRIPYAYITNTEVYGLALYPADTTDVSSAEQLHTNWSAYYIFKNEDNITRPLEISSEKNYNLIVDWVLTVGNNKK